MVRTYISRRCYTPKKSIKYSNETFQIVNKIYPTGVGDEASWADMGILVPPINAQGVRKVKN
mgnify:CR=1 FL=1